MRYLPKQKYDPNLLVGYDTSDDAGVYRLTNELAMIQTVDFFTPIVDDPYMFGQIAAANALSDVYAMGGKPTTVMNIVGFPIKKLVPEILADILRGAADKTQEAGAILVGGHSIDDQEPKFGLAVTGLVHPDRIFKNVGSKPGDKLVLTKPIGVGIVTTGIKRNVVTAEQEKVVTETMALLNKQAAENLEDFNPNAVTDITGFGLLGHSYEMANGSDVTFELNVTNIPVLAGTHELAEEGIIPGGSKENRRWLKTLVEYESNITDVEMSILCDSITSGGLLISLPAAEATSYVEVMHNNGAFATIIGTVTEKKEKSVIVKKYSNL